MSFQILLRAIKSGVIRSYQSQFGCLLEGVSSQLELACRCSGRFHLLSSLRSSVRRSQIRLLNLLLHLRGLLSEQRKIRWILPLLTIYSLDVIWFIMHRQFVWAEYVLELLHVGSSCQDGTAPYLLVILPGYSLYHLTWSSWSSRTGRLLIIYANRLK